MTFRSVSVRLSRALGGGRGIAGIIACRPVAVIHTHPLQTPEKQGQISKVRFPPCDVRRGAAAAAAAAGKRAGQRYERRYRRISHAFRIPRGELKKENKKKSTKQIRVTALNVVDKKVKRQQQTLSFP